MSTDSMPNTEPVQETPGAGPIADLSYRHYDGPLDKPIARWWSIASLSMQLSLRKRGFWWWAIGAGYWYYALLMIFWFLDTFLPLPEGMEKNPILSQIIWKDQFINGFSISQLLLFIVAWLVGAGTIANDVRANALLVYLSKPLDRKDYIIGKWLGIFVPVTIAAALPTYIFYLYGMLSFQNYGFLSDPWLWAKLIPVVLLPGVFYASLVLGISSIASSGRMAGVIFAGLYFLPWFFTKSMQLLRFVGSQNGQKVPGIIDTLYYCSLDGIQIGLAKIMLQTSGSPLFPSMGGPGSRRARNMTLPIPSPDPALFWSLFAVICVAGIAIAYSRVKAVEVVG